MARGCREVREKTHNGCSGHWKVCGVANGEGLTSLCPSHSLFAPPVDIQDPSFSFPRFCHPIPIWLAEGKAGGKAGCRQQGKHLAGEV